MFFKKYLEDLGDFDWVLFGSIFLLICFGLATLYSIAISSEEADFGNFRKQILFTIIGLILLFFFAFFDYKLLADYSLFIYIAVSMTLVAVLLFGVTIHGTTGWFSIFGLNFQPVELAKVALIIFLAWFLNNNIAQVKSPSVFIKTLLAAGFLFFLVILQPDFGSATILILIWFALVFFAGVNKKYLIILIIFMILFSGIAWAFLFQDYQKARILTFINPNADPYNEGYHVRQALIAVGAGEFFGRGLGFGSQSQLKFIPASQTDFIFAVIAEELGYVGVLLVIFFWGLIFSRLIKASKQMKDNFSLLFILGVSAVLFSHVMINIGMNLGIVPVTGIPLPFLSYGGSFMIVVLSLSGIVQSMIIRANQS